MLSLILILLIAVHAAQGKQDVAFPTNSVFEDGQIKLYYDVVLTDEDTVQWTLRRNANSPIRITLFASASEKYQSYTSYHTFLSSGYGLLSYYRNQDTLGIYNIVHMESNDIKEWQLEVISTTSPSMYWESTLTENILSSHDCSVVTSDGNIVPVFSWKRGLESPDGTALRNTTYSSYETRWTSTLQFYPEVADIYRPFSCNVTFRYIGPSGPGIDTSDPDYYVVGEPKTYTSIRYSVRNTTITPSSNQTENGILILMDGDRLTCDAKGYSNVRYDWTVLEGNEDFSSTGSTLTIKESMIHNNVSVFHCMAYNSVDGVQYTSNATITFYIGHESGIYRSPTATFAVLGKSTDLTCQKSSQIGGSEWRVQWFAQFYGGYVPEIIYNALHGNGEVVEKWQDDFVHGEKTYDLTVRRAEFETAGIYSCVAFDDSNYFTRGAPLTVVSPLRCIGPVEEVQEREVVDLDCVVDYAMITTDDFELQPQLKWFDENGELFGYSAIDGGVPPAPVTASLLRKHTVFPSDHMMTFRCELEFKNNASEILKDEKMTYTDSCEIVLRVDGQN